MEKEVPKPWERQEGETDKAFHAFTLYRDMGPNRSLPKLSSSIGKSWEKYGKNVLGGWSSSWAWQARVAAWDAWVDQERQNQFHETILKEAEQDAQAALAFIGKALRALQKLSEDDLNPDQILKFWERGITVRRQARGLPDQIHEVKISEGEKRALSFFGELVSAEGGSSGDDPGEPDGD